MYLSKLPTYLSHFAASIGNSCSPFRLSGTALKLASVTLCLLVISAASNAVFGQDDENSQKIISTFKEAQDAHEKGNLERALDLYKKVLELAPNLPEAEYQSGVVLLALRRSEDAETSFRKAVEARPDWSLALAALGDSIVARHKRLSMAADSKGSESTYTEATEILRKAIAVDADNAPAWVALADLRLFSPLGAGLLRETLVSIRNLTDGKMNPPVALWNIRAALERRLGDDKSAEASLKKALAADPGNRGALIALAEIFIRRDDVAAGSEIAARLTKTYPEDDGVKLLNARVFAAEGKSDEALKAIAGIVQPPPEAVELRNRIASSTNENVADLEAQLERSPADASILGRLCVLERISAPEKALDYCRRASEAEPNNIKHAIGFGAALVQAKQFDRAAAIFSKIIELEPNNSTAHANLAAALFQLKRYSAARDEYQWLIDHNNGVPIAYYLIGITHDQLGAYLDAMANYQLFLKFAEPAINQLEIDKVKLRLPSLQKQISQMKNKKPGR